jgi:diguanylate cyclase (GGDEF)-like protein
MSETSFNHPADNAQDTLIKLLKLSRSLLSTREIDKLLALIVRAFLQATEADRAYLLLKEGAALKAVYGESKEGQPIETQDAPRISSLSEQVVRDGQAIYSTNLDLDQKIGMRASINELGLHMVVCVPLRGPSGIVGMIYCDGKTTLDTVFTTSNRSALEALADHAGAAIENARLFEGAIRDPLTGLFNLGFFQLKVGEMCEQHVPLVSGQSTFLAVIEVEDTAGVAARLGPQVENEALKALADSLRAHVHAQELTARLGPRTFAACFAENDENAAQERFRRLIAHNTQIRVPSLGDGHLALRLGVGIAPLSNAYDDTMARASRAASRALGASTGVVLV